MSLRRTLGITLLATATSVALVGTASAAPYGPHTGSASVSRTRVVQDQSVTVSGDGFCASTAVKVRVTQGSKRLISRTITSSSSGVARTTQRLTKLGSNLITLSGCFPAGGTQVLSARVNVVPHSGALRADDHKVDRGDRVKVRAAGFCRSSAVLVRVYDDGHRYQSRTIRADRRGAASTSVQLTRSGRSMISLQGCRSKGGTALMTTEVTVRNH